MTAEQFIETWSMSQAAERANKDSFVRDLCDELGVPRPDPTENDPERDQYVFEKSIDVHTGDGETVNRIDLYKAGCFVPEAKQGGAQTAAELAKAVRAKKGWEVVEIVEGIADLGALVAVGKGEKRKWRVAGRGAA